MANNFKIQDGLDARGTVSGGGLTVTGEHDLRFDSNGSKITEQRPGQGYDFNAVPTVTVTGSGYGATVNVSYGVGDTSYSSANINDAGQGYNIGDQIKITGDLLGGTTPANDIVLEITSLANGHSGPWAAEGSNIISGTPITYEDGLHIRTNGLEWTFGNDGNLILNGGVKFGDGTTQATSLEPQLTKSNGNLVASTTLEFQGDVFGSIFDIDSIGNFDVWIQSVTGDSDGMSYAIGSNDDGYNFVYALNPSGTVSWKVGLDDILGYDNTAYGIKYSSGYLYLSCQYYNNDAGENQLSVLKLDATDGTVNNSWILTNSSNIQYRPRDITVNSSGDPIVVGQSFNDTQTFSGLTPQAGSGSQVLVVNASDINNLPQVNPWSSYYVHTDPSDPSAWYQVNSVNHLLNVPTVVVTGGGNGGLTLDIRYMYSNGNWVFDWVQITNYGVGYNEGDQVKVLGSSIGGTDVVDDIILSHNGWYMNVLSVGGVAGNLCPSFVSSKVRFNTDQNVDFSTGTWDVRVGLGSQAFVWTPNWQHSYGDTANQDFKSVNVDSSGNIYLLGYFEYYDGSNYHNVLAMKLNSSGVRQWSKYIEDDSNSSQDPGTIIPDSSGNCFITSQNNSGYTLVTKLDSAGDVVWQARQTDNNNWNNYCVGGLDSNGDVIVMGSWYGNNNNNYVISIHKLSKTDGSLIWARDFSNHQDYDMYEYYDEDGQAGHVVGDNFYFGGYCYDASDNRYVGFGFRLPTDGTGTGTYGRYVYSANTDTQYEVNTNNAILITHTYNPNDNVSMTYVETSATTTIDSVGSTTPHHWAIGTSVGLTGVESITFSDGTVQATAASGAITWTSPNSNVWRIETYNGGYSGYYGGSDYDAKWFDAGNSPGGTNNFRGAIIEYHAFFENCGTMIGTIHLTHDQTPQEATHTEHMNGNNNIPLMSLWTTNDNRYQLYFKRTDGSGQNIMIQWTAKMFYGSENWC